MALLIVFCAAPSRSYAVDQSLLLKWTPQVAESVPAANRVRAYAKTAAGALVRFNPVGGAVTTGVTVVGMVYAYANEDKVAEMLMKGTEPETPDGWTDPNTPPPGQVPEGYQEGKYWYISGGTQKFNSPGALLQWYKTLQSNPTEWTVSQYSSTDWKLYENGAPRSIVLSGNCTGSHSGESYCQTVVVEPDLDQKWPENGVTTFVQDANGYWVPHGMENSADVNGFTLPREWYWVDHDNSSGFGTSHYDGSQTIKEYLQKINSAGKTVTDVRTTKIDKDGKVVTVQDAVIDGTVQQAMEATKNSAQIAVEFPDDYAREGTQVEIKDWLKQEVTPPAQGDGAYSGGSFDTLTNAITGALPELPVLNEVPSIDSSGSCQTINLSWEGIDLEFPSSSQCAKLHTARDMIGYILYLITALALVGIATGRQGGTV